MDYRLYLTNPAGAADCHPGRIAHYGDEIMYAIPIVLLVVGIIGGLALGFIMGKLKGENETLKLLMERRRRTKNDIALFEDALAVVTDLVIRQQVEEKRNEAVSNYFFVRMAHLREVLGEGRNGFDYKSGPANRPKDY